MLSRAVCSALSLLWGRYGAFPPAATLPSGLVYVLT